MISLWLEKRRKKAQATVLGVEYDYASLAAVKLNKTDENYSLMSCDSQIFSPDAYFEEILTTEYIGNILANIVVDNKFSRFTKLGFISYEDIDVSKEEIVCDKKSLEVITKEGVSFYLREHFFKRKYPSDYINIAFDYYDELEDKGVITVYYINETKSLEKLNIIASKAKRALAVCALDRQVLINFMQELYLSELSKNTKDSIFFGLYADKLCICSFTPKGELKNYESVKIFDSKIDDTSYIDEAIQLLLRFMDFMSLDFSEDSDFDNFSDQENVIYVYGLKDGFEKIVESIKELSMKDCRILDPFINIDCEAFGEKVYQPYRFVMPVAIALREVL
ncbi:MAG: hypothetical protein ACI9BN_000195 [Francisella sp.]|jgi:hypothetical protein